MQLRLRLRGVLLALAVIVSCDGCTQRPTPPQVHPLVAGVDPFPPVSEFTEVRARLESVDGPDTLWVDIPRDRWHGIVNAFLPSAVDPEPVPWEISGWVEIVTAKETVRVMFSAGDDVLFRVKDEYYQGGDGEELLRQLSDAK